MVNDIQIVKALFNVHKENIPPIYWKEISNIEALNPGMDGTAIKMVLENINVINENRILVVSGPVGCGKTFAAFILALYRDWTNLIESDYEKALFKLLNGDDEDLIEAEIYESDDEAGALKFAFQRYHNWIRNRNRFRFDRAIEVIELGFDIKSLRNFSNLVIIDDLGREYFTDKGFGISRWDGFFDVRYSKLLPTLITTNMTPEEFIEKYNVRIYDRLKQIAEWITINEKSLRGKQNEH